MPRPIDRDGLRRLMSDGAQVAEVLPEPEYRYAHLPGAMHLPLIELTEDAAEAALDRTRPVVVYCNDFL